MGIAVRLERLAFLAVFLMVAFVTYQGTVGSFLPGLSSVLISALFGIGAGAFSGALALFVVRVVFWGLGLNRTDSE